MDLSQFDDDTALFIIQLQLEDVEMMKESLGKGKHREGETPDIQVSVDLLKAELDALQQRINDRVMSRSMACAVELDALVIQEAEEGQEQQDATDHQMALGLTEDANTTDNPNDPPAEPTAQVSQIPSVNRWVPRHLRDNQPDRRPESSKQGASRPPGAQPTSACVACSDTFPVVNLMSAPCSHSYCAACVRELFTSSMADESLFPPRCCGQTIPIDSNIAILGPELAQSCQEKKIEYETTNRTYCHVPSCSTFIPPSQIRVYSAKCPRCSAVTCPFCKAEYHLGNCAPNDDPGLQQVLDLAKEQGWQQCKKCSRVVELGRGCYHMTCLCSAEFCYLCNADWKTCKCVQWDEDRLLDRAQEIAARDRQRLRTAEERAAMVAGLQNHLRDNHNCTHTTWNYRPGRGRCEHCRDLMPMFTYVCAQCRTMACSRCRHNRL